MRQSVARQHHEKEFAAHRDALQLDPFLHETVGARRWFIFRMVATMIACVHSFAYLDAESEVVRVRQCVVVNTSIAPDARRNAVVLATLRVGDSGDRQTMYHLSSERHVHMTIACDTHDTHDAYPTWIHHVIASVIFISTGGFAMFAIQNPSKAAQIRSNYDAEAEFLEKFDALTRSKK